MTQPQRSIEQLDRLAIREDTPRGLAGIAKRDRRVGIAAGLALVAGHATQSRGVIASAGAAIRPQRIGDAPME